jgi:Predicted nucleotide-binding protein containing TIR-like domain
MEEKPSLVIGSSQKGLEAAEEIKKQLSDTAEVTIWPELFLPNENYFSSLLTTNLKFDFSVMIFTPDDNLITKEKEVKSARDNVIFELGLAIGRLGAKRSFAVIEKSVNIPTDLAGLKLLKFEKNDAVSLEQSLAPACTQLRKIIKEQFEEPQLGLLPSTALAIGYYSNFLQKVCDALLNEVKQVQLDDKIPGSIWKNDSNNFIITVVIPESLAYLNPKQIQHRLKENELTGIQINTGSRPYPLYIKAEVADNSMLHLYDLPTTLFASMESIEKAVPNDFPEYEQIENILQIRELKNFKKTLENILNKSKNQLYRKYITIEYRTELK